MLNMDALVFFCWVNLQIRRCTGVFFCLPSSVALQGIDQLNHLERRNPVPTRPTRPSSLAERDG